MRPLLAMDTATRTASVALLDLDTEKPILEMNEPVQTHGKALVPMVQRCLSMCGTSPKDLAAVACGAGPGSFTGLRVGLATAKGLSLTLDIPLLLPGSLPALSMRVPPSADRLVAGCLDARRSEVYVAVYRWDGSVPPEEIGGPMVMDPESVISMLSEVIQKVKGPSRPKALVLAGEGALLYRQVMDCERATEKLGLSVTMEEIDPPVPSAANLGLIAAWMLASGRVADIHQSQPIYLRSSDAERTKPSGRPRS